MKTGQFEVSGFYAGDALELSRALPDESIQCIVTSPPYWGLRDYEVEGQLGMERTPEEYVKRLVGIFRELRRALKADGTFWLNLGDSYTSGGRDSYGTFSSESKQATHSAIKSSPRPPQPSGLKPKDLCMIPSRVALALQADGWYLRSEIIWEKSNPMPESAKDRPTSSHEKLFLLAKSSRYYYDGEAIAAPVAAATNTRVALADKRAGRNNAIDNPRTPDPRKKQDALGKRTYLGFNDRYKRSREARVSEDKYADGRDHLVVAPKGETRNARDVWTMPTRPGAKTHFATFPPELPRRCIMAGTREGDIVLDPFCGSGTTARVAEDLGRRWLGFDLSAEYIEKHCEPRLAQRGLFGRVERE